MKKLTRAQQEVVELLERHFSSYRMFRRWIGGTWYRMRTALPMADIWCQKPFKNCQAYIVQTEHHQTNRSKGYLRIK